MDSIPNWLDTNSDTDTIPNHLDLESFLLGIYSMLPRLHGVQVMLILKVYGVIYLISDFVVGMKMVLLAPEMAQGLEEQV